MRVLLLCSAAALIPVISFASPQCVLDTLNVTAPIESQPTTGEVGLPSSPSLTPVVEGRPVQPPVRPDVAVRPALDHVVAAGAQLTDAGLSHGLRVVVARASGEFMRLYVAPDEQALVAGLMSDLSVTD